ncbi:MAG TPA: hypothetical protein VF030_02900 [Solirubrobacterales bacterium]
MAMTVTLFLAIALTTIGYAAFGQGGGVAGMVFFGVLLIGASIGVLRSLVSGSDLR